jgi:nitroreductase
MDVQRVIKNRRSIRKFRDKRITEEVINKLIEALIWAPSAGNLQARKFYFVFNDEVKEKLAHAALDQDFIAEAPLVVVACADYKRIEWKYGERGKNLYAPLDVALSVENLLLAAVELGLGGVTVGAFDEKEMAEILKLPKSQRPIFVVPLGFPAESPEPPERVSKEEAVEFVK